MGRYFEEFRPGEEFVTESRTVTESDVVTFAGLSGDFNPLHTDKTFAEESPFGERIAHGLLGLSLASGLISRLGVFNGTALAFLGLKEWRFQGPIRIGDTLHASFNISDKRETSRPDRGIITRSVELLNQDGEVIQSGEMLLMMQRRPERVTSGPSMPEVEDR